MGSAMTGELACMDIRAKWGRTAHYSTVAGLERRSRRQRSEQKRTSSQQRSHFLRQAKGRPHPWQGLLGKFTLATRLPLPLPSPIGPAPPGLLFWEAGKPFGCGPRIRGMTRGGLPSIRSLARAGLRCPLLAEGRA